ncbi:EipA family protein [Croceibacterium xixiisoli]
MMIEIANWCRVRASAVGLALAMVAIAPPALAQGIQSVDPDAAIDADLNTARPNYDVSDNNPQPSYDDRIYDVSPEQPGQPTYPTYPAQTGQPAQNNGFEESFGNSATYGTPNAAAPAGTTGYATTAAASDNTFQQDDLIGAAEGVFGKGAEGLAGLIEDILRKQGEPNAYIVGREGGGAFVLGVRYGSGTLHHKVEGQMPVYWTGPSIGFDAGANAGSTFVLVYNLYDSADLYERFPAGEGQLYLVGGFNASYMRRGDVVLIPIRVGAGLRVGVNAGYMKFSRKQKWLPF